MHEDTLQNKLKEETSAYLKSAAGQPVHWQPWGAEAFERARELNRPVLLDIGAVWCHWCHVMDRESYENDAVAKIINEHFVAVKVDRDERPDVDVRYQRAVSAMTGQGGWPLTAFLTPEGKVFFGGTYFPPSDSYGRPGFSSLLKNIASTYRDNPEAVQRDAEKLFAHLIQKRAKGQTAALNTALLDPILQSFRSHFDSTHGGFGGAPKFPHTQAVEFLFLVHSPEKNWALAIALRTLTEMGKGGIYDQLGGAFHRYSTDERWVVPHFEKMLYDNSGLLSNYCQGFLASGRDPFYKEIAQDIMRYTDRWGSDPAGGFYASQDADITMDDDGDYYTWTRKEVEALLAPEEARVLVAYYDIYENGEMQHAPQRNVLFIARDLEEIAKTEKITLEECEVLFESGKAKLLHSRDKRQAPFIDKTLYTNWNGMMIKAYLDAYRAFGDTQARDFALKTLDRVMCTALRKGEGLAHSFSDDASSVRGIFDDQIQIAAALVAAFEVTGDWNYLDEAEALVQFSLERFWDPEGGGFLDRDPTLDAVGSLMQSPQKLVLDSPTPSSNGIAAQVLLKLNLITGREVYRQKAQKTLEVFAQEAVRSGLFASAYAIALHDFFNPPVHAVIVGDNDVQATQDLIRAVLGTYRPGMVLTLVDPSEISRRPLPEIVKSQIQSAPATPTAYICAGTTCAPPTQNPAELTRIVADFSL